MLGARTRGRSRLATARRENLNKSARFSLALAARGLPYRLATFMPARFHHRFLLLAERTSWALGLIGLMSWGAFHAGVAVATSHDLERFAALRDAAQEDGTPDQSLWSAERIRAWRQALLEPTPPPLGVLRIPKIRLEVAILPGTDDRTLDRAVGHIEGTAQPGTDGNLGIAGHRDGFFRGLKDITSGDVIELDTIQGTDVYRVERTWVVNPEEVSGTRSDAHTRADTGHLLSLLLHRFCPEPVHCSRRACRRWIGTRAGVP